MTQIKTERTTAASRGMSAGRTALAGLLAAVGYVVGFYAGLAVVLSIAGFNEVSGGGFELATVPAGTLTAGLAASLAAPQSRRVLAPLLGSAAVVAAVTTSLLIVLDGDYGAAMAIGGVCAVIAATVTTVMIARD